MVSEEYYPVPLGETAAQVCGRIAVRSRHNQLGAVNRFTIGWRLIGGKLKLVHQHNSYEYTQPDIEGERGVLKMDMNTTQFVRNLLLEQPAGRRIAFPSGNQTMYDNPYTILYAQSRDKRTELVCVDRVVSCNYIYRELKEKLPGVFYPLRRGYLVNTLYASTVIVLKTPKTESSVRKVWMPKTVAYILREWKASQDKQKEFLGSEYLDYNLVVALPNGRPCEETVISNAFRRLKRDAQLPDEVFHSLRHSRTTYKLKLNHGDIKATQGDTGHSQADMVTKVYAHILDEDRKVNAQKFESAFYAN